MEVSEQRTRYKIDDAVPKPNNTNIDLRLLAMYAESAGLVGIDGPRDELIQLMDRDGVPSYQLKVVSIVGFGGLGKTTLANQVYHKLEGEFQCTTFVSVSQKPNIRKILRTILYHVGFNNSSIQTWEENELISVLQKFLSDKRYFIVIDDIWDASAWDIIRCALPENMNGSRVITTTRIETLARSCCNNNSEYVYKMKPLSDQDSRSLFFKRIFGSEDGCPPYLKEVSVGILKKCAGLPLAIITVSSLLATQPVKLKERWEYVLNSLGSNFDVSPSLEGMRQILNLSYINLPHYLKTCMLYLGIYPQDYTIHTVDLTRQWVAEGFISKSHGIDQEDVAKSYFNELMNRSMIQPVDTDHNSEVMSCKVHDLMLDLILQKSREENFIAVIYDIQDMTRQHDKIRRLSLHLDGEIDDTGLESIQLSQIRTVAGFRTSSLYGPRLTLFKHLRVFTIEISSTYGIPKSVDLSGIYNLYQLRYIKVKSYDAVVIPTEIVGMQLLETFHLPGSHWSSSCRLSLSSCPGEYIDQLPSYIVHMRHLLHLVVPEGILLPDGIGNMKSLRTLHYPDFTNDSLDNVKGLKELTNFRDLDIGRSYISFPYSDEMMEKVREILRACLEKLCNLKYLCIRSVFDNMRACLDILCSVPASFCHLQRLHIHGSFWFSRVPEWLCQLRGLCDLCLPVKEVLEDDVGIISQLPSLVFFDLYIGGVAKDKVIIRGTGFPALKQFTFSCCRISYLTFEAGAMPKLERLELCFNAQGWDRYGGMPAGIEYLSGLKEIIGDIGCDVAKESNIRAAESALRDMAGLHPGHPVSNIKFDSGRTVFDGMYDEPDEEEDGEGGSSA
ncbi:unnamed protein product [Miscanthus lutarioriparius]|uniref:NB-ARC domain-containing protein n=1 Tax=Miscanthus lutarioriparius TaxID=422564 RepID=A0A811R9K4_9POAL|nr:unnamed protein product [Miscanthus lutarioriparius]